MADVRRWVPLAAMVLLSGCAAAVIGGGAEAGLVSHASRSLGTIIDDHVIELRTRGVIDGQPDLRHAVHINAYSEAGTLLLTGEAPTPELRDEVLRLAQGVPNVKRIVNEITIAPPSTMAERAEDSWLTTQVKARLVGTRGIDATHIRVITSNQVVYLMGLVPRAQGEAAASAAAAVPNVVRIVELFQYSS
ncbi:MAG TPA: BON domain-containing protein [Acidiferrobacteraceae bacterium]|nr:BON domain-containing protein [Acidiferrobacteraceae bacterium]